MPYTVVWTEDAEAEFDSLPRKIMRQVATKVNRLEAHPVPSGAKKLAGHDQLYRLRSGSYRIVYQWDGRGSTVTVARVGPRGSVYAGL